MATLAEILSRLQGAFTPQFDDPLSRALVPALLGGYDPRTVERGTVHRMDPRQTREERFGTISQQPPPVDMLARAMGGGQGLPWMAGLAMEAGADPETAHKVDALAGIIGQAMEAKAAKGTASASALAGSLGRARVYHGTRATRYEPGQSAAGNAEAFESLKALAQKHGISSPLDVAPVFERWAKSGYSGITPDEAARVRSLHDAARPRTSPGREVLAFDKFKMPIGDGELGVHVGNEGAASIYGKPFPFEARINNPLRLPDLGTWKARDVIRSAKAAGVNINDSEAASVLGSRDKNGALRALLSSKGFDGIVYRNKSEGFGDSWIAFDPSQLTPLSE